MPLQNRVDPFGTIHAVAERGTLMGNRGIIHDPATRTLLRRRWTTRAWIICVCAFRGRRRDVMAKRSWTELFFLDEATALAAGHRPCFYCQHARAEKYAAAFADGRGVKSMRAPEIDAILHGERLAVGNEARALDVTAVAALPDGTMIAAGGKPYLIRHERALPWSFAGYGEAVAIGRLAGASLSLITPPSTVAALRAGYPATPPTSA
jgi:hypothetical protein